MPNHEAIIENIRKLEGMGLHGDELLAQLEAIGIPRIQGERWVRQAHANEKNSSNAQPAQTNSPFFNEQSSTRTENVMEEKKERTPEPMPSRSYVPPAPPQPLATEKLWEKGILTIVDTKLAQMERLKKEIDDIIEQHVDTHYNAMERKLEALFDAQRELYKFKIDAELNAKTKEVEDILDEKIKEIKTINLTTQEDLQRIKGQKMGIDDAMKGLNEQTHALDVTKKTILHDVGEKLEELQEKVDEMMSETETRVHEVEARATKTLELEEKITSGLGDQMEQQANKILDERIDDLRMDIKKEIIELKKMGADLASKDIQAVIREFSEMNVKLEGSKKEIDAIAEQKTREMDKMMSQKMLEIDKIVNTKMETIVTQKEQSFFKKIEDQTNELSSVKRELGQKLLETETRLQNLDVFQKQFIEILRKSTVEREEVSTILKKKVEAFDAKADEKIAIIDQRLKQLDAVVGELAQLLTQWKNAQGMQGIGTQSLTPPVPPAHEEKTNHTQPKQIKPGFLNTFKK